MPKYTVRSKEFDSFSALVQWVLDTYKIDFEGGEIASCSQCGWWSNNPDAFHACEYVEENCE